MSLLLLAFFAFFSVSCGRSDSATSADPETTTGQFIDDPVAGLDYSCSSGTSGVTNLNGEYVCDTGDDVSFSLGPIVIGTVVVQEFAITPYSFFPNDPQAAVNLARLLQSLDSDGDPGNGVIVIDDGLVALLPAGTNFASPTFDSDIEDALGAGFALISPEVAQAQLNSVIIQLGGSVPAGGYLPVADAGADQSVATTHRVTLDGQSSFDADGDVISYAWSFVLRPLGSRAALSDPSAVYPTFVADLDGSYLVQLVVNDGTVSSDADTVTVMAATPNSIPIADAGLDQEVFTNTRVTLDGTDSFDSDGDPLSYSWLLVSRPAGSSAALVGATTSTPSFTPDVDGGYIVELEVDDGMLADADTVVITAVSNTRPLASAGRTQHVTTGSSVALDGSASLDQDGDPLSYAWTFSSRPVGSNASLSNTGIPSPAFTADRNGTYVLRLVVHDGTDYSDPDTVDVVSHPVAAENAPPLEWIVETGTHQFDRANDIAVDSAANIYVVGNTRGSLDGQASSGYGDLFIIKYGSDGTHQWTMQRVGTGHYQTSGEEARGIAVDEGRNALYVIGSTYGDLGGQQNSGGRDFFLTRYDTDGAHQWTVVHGTTVSDIGYDVAVDSAGNVYVTGMTEGALDGNTQHGGPDIFISKYDEAGNRQWTVQPGTNNYEYGYGIATDPDSNVYVVGYSGAGLDGNRNLGQTDMIVTKYDTSGLRLWTRQIGTLEHDTGNAIAVDSNGDVYVTGISWGSLGGTNRGQDDVAIVKLDTDGALLWARLLGSAGREWGYGIALDSVGSVHVSGYTSGPLSGNVSMGNADYFIAKYDSTGRYLWTLQDGRSLEDWSTAVAIGPADNIYATGVTHALLPNRASGDDIFIAKYGDNLATGGPYTVGGVATGVIGTFILTNNGGDAITLEDSGPFTFPTALPDAAAYRVEVPPHQGGGQICVVSGGDDALGSGSIPGADVTRIVVTCSGV